MPFGTLDDFQKSLFLNRCCPRRDHDSPSRQPQALNICVGLQRSRRPQSRDHAVRLPGPTQTGSFPKQVTHSSSEADTAAPLPTAGRDAVSPPATAAAQPDLPPTGLPRQVYARGNTVHHLCTIPHPLSANLLPLRTSGEYSQPQACCSCSGGVPPSDKANSMTVWLALCTMWPMPMGLPPTCSPSIVGMMIYGPSLTAHAHLGPWPPPVSVSGLAARQRPEHEPVPPSAGARGRGLHPRSYTPDPGSGLLCLLGGKGVEKGQVELRCETGLRALLWRACRQCRGKRRWR